MTGVLGSSIHWGYPITRFKLLQTAVWGQTVAGLRQLCGILKQSDISSLDQWHTRDIHRPLAVRTARSRLRERGTPLSIPTFAHEC